MPFARRTAPLLLAGLMAVGGAARADVPGDFREAAFNAQRSPDRAVETWAAFARKHPDHVLGKTARLHAAMHRLRRAGEETELGPIAEQAAFNVPDGAQGLEARLGKAAKTLRALVQMRALERRLGEYYARHVEFPPSLKALVEERIAEAPELTDPFGQRFAYSPKTNDLLSMERQDFELRCRSLGLALEVVPALLDAALGPIDKLALEGTSVERGQAYAMTRREDGTYNPSRAWEVGQDRAGFTLWAIHETFAIAGRKNLPRVLLVEQR